MEGDPPPAPPATSLTARFRQQLLAQRQPSSRDPTWQERGQTPAARFRRTPPRLAREGEKPLIGSGSLGTAGGRALTRKLSGAQQRPLVPATERKSQEENVTSRRAKKGSQEDDKWDITPDGGSAGREGRQFTVANVGNNGRIYLRPTVRPANQRYPQPHFVFPMTPPGTAGLDALASDTSRDLEDGAGFPDDSHWNTVHTLTPAATRTEGSGERIVINRTRRRAVSDSTIPDTSIARESEPGGFKIIITQPGDEHRPRTTEDLDMNRPPLLEVAIPSWRIGTPRFSIRGTPFIRGSSYAPTEDVRSSTVSFLGRTPKTMTMSTAKRPGAGGLPAIHVAPVDPADPPRIVSPVFPRPLRSTYMSTHLVIEPAMFDALTFKPACDDRAIVRYSSVGSVTAASPPRLVAEITSPSFLDYELLSDFFLTFRSFLESSDLLRMLFARLRWALARSDEAGMVVRVRTFVALRHWILNYFVDDFVGDYSLRAMFCTLLNDFVDELSQDLRARKVQLKILAELKKCWRRVCGQYWDGPDFDASLAPDVAIAPGGIAGHRDPNLDPNFYITSEDGPPQIDGVVLPTHPDQTSFYAEVSRAGHIDSIVVGDRPGTPEDQIDPGFDRNPASPTSIASVDVVSCSFPTKNMRFGQPGASYPLAVHPVDPSSVYNNTDPIAMTPRALVGKRVRAQPSHKRNGSLSDSLREHASVTEKLLFKNAEFLLALPYAGSIVRGNMFPPGQAYVEVLPPSAAGAPSRQTTLFQPQAVETVKEKGGGSAMSGRGMQKLLGSVRRALSTKGQSVSPTQGNFINISPIGPRGATTNRLPGTAIVPQARPHQNGARPPVRIDLLGAEVAEDFKRAVREDAEAEAERHGYLAPPDAIPRVPDEMLEYSAAHMDTTFAFSDRLDARPTSDMGITTGSKSIVIVDDTLLPEDFPSMAGALPAANSSVDAFTDTFMQNVADPTPPNTPPGQPMGTPRRSSYILSQHVLRSSLSADPLPPFIPDMATLGGNARPSEDSTRPSFDSPRVRGGPPLSGIYRHSRQRSSRSYRSNRSIGHRRYASYTSGIMPQPTIRSFDATTYSEASLDESSQVLIPQPLRVLRRRPGGDLRAATNVGELDPATLRRSRSVGSLTTYTESFCSSYVRSPVQESSGYVDVGSSDFSSPKRVEAFSLGAIAEQNPKRNISLFSTHSSKPIMRPSFEAEAQKLAQIPDDLDDDGGVESALLKLEGRYEKKIPAKLSMDLNREAPDFLPPAASELGDIPETVVSVEEKKEHRNVHVVEGPLLPSSIIIPADVQNSLLGVDIPRSGDVLSFLSDDSRASYNSIPLLDRGLTDDGRSRRTDTREWTDQSILQGPDESAGSSQDHTPRDSQHPSYEFIKKTESMEGIDSGSVIPRDRPARASGEQSFLDVESDDDTDLSSELSADVVDLKEGDSVTPSRIGIAVSTLPVHPLADSPPYIPTPATQSPSPPSPPMTLIQALHMGPPDAVNVPIVQEHQVWEKPLPPTPDTTPTTAAAPYTQYPLASPVDPTGTKEALRNAPKLQIADPVPEVEPQADNKFSVHLPFILAFDSDILAQQFTLIEKDALNEIDWKELIEMRWKNAEQNGINARSWVSFLRDTDARGVEVVIARFNIMVKWAISEIVLTQNIEERARCMIKFIHIASHCRKYRNFATMSQLTIALTSNEVSRLSKTWTMVPASDKRTMADLEALVSPTRNFYNLRAEMEGGGSTGTAVAEMGCIPFVGIYTHDLLFNAQRPSEIASSPTTAPLVNFERCRTSASIVKTLLRLLEASSLYNFQPIEGITERCLWMGALTDEEIRKHGDSLE